MNSRQRLRQTLNHIDPGKVVLDLGSTAITGIAAGALARLRRSLGLEDHLLHVHEPFQLLGFVEEDLLQAIGADVLGIWPLGTMFGFRNRAWKPWYLPDGTEVLVSDEFVLSQDDEGNQYLHPAGNLDAPPSAKLPRGGYYFDNIIRPSPYDEAHLDGKSDFAEQYQVIPEEELRWAEEQSYTLYQNTEFGLIGQLPGASLGDIAHIPGPGVENPRGIRDPMEWYIAHLSHPDYIRDIFAYQTEIALRNAELYWQAVGSRAEAVVVSGTDFGTQRAELISPDLFRQLYKPFYAQINAWIHKHTTWKTFFHSCGSIARLLDDLVDCGVNILNPVQWTAAGMDAQFLKQTYGDVLVFWGGGVDTQRTLPFGSPQEVYDEVMRQLRLFSPGGGYVFNTIHNIQADTPVENILAMFEAIQAYREIEERSFDM